jgi:hypothetical protein
MNSDFDSVGDVVSTLKRYSAIIVTGPQRSGTTIASIMMATDLEYRLWDEQLHMNNYAKVLRGVSRPHYPGVVVQAPALSWCIEKLPRMNNALVVWMLRDRIDIENSQKRVGWLREREELSRYISKWGCSEGERVFDAKLRIWKEIQSKSMKVDIAELSYTSEYIRTHPMFRTKSNRSSFEAKQVLCEQDKHLLRDIKIAT